MIKYHICTFIISTTNHNNHQKYLFYLNDFDFLFIYQGKNSIIVLFKYIGQFAIINWSRFNIAKSTQSNKDNLLNNV